MWAIEMCIFCGWPVPQDRPCIHDTVSLEHKLLMKYIQAYSKTPVLEGRPSTTVSMVRSIKSRRKRTPISFRPKPRRPLPCHVPRTHIEVESKFLSWQHIERNRARSKLHDASLDLPARQWVVDERNPNGKFLVACPPQTPLDRIFHAAAAKLERWWRVCLAKMFCSKLIASKKIQNCFRIYMAKTLYIRAKKRQEEIEKGIQDMYNSRYRHAMDQWRLAAVKNRNERKFGLKLKNMFSNNMLGACLESLAKNVIIEKRQEANVIKHFHHVVFVRFRRRVFDTWYNWYCQNCNIRGFVIERCMKRWHRNVRYIVLKRKQDAERRGATGFQRLYRGHRGRVTALMMVHEAEMDMVSFLEMRSAMATKINNRVRIYLSHRRVDSRQSARHCVALLWSIAAGKANVIEQRNRTTRARRLEAIRQQDEEDYVCAEIKRAMSEEVTSRVSKWKARWWLPGKQYIIARKYGRKGRDPREILSKEMLSTLSARVRRESRKDFRDRWPPAFECETCHKAFTTGHDYSLHMC